MISAGSAFDTMNRLGSRGLPFIFIVDFEGKEPIVVPLQEAELNGIFFDIRGNHNIKNISQKIFPVLLFEKFPVDFITYLTAFQDAMKGLTFGNSYLLNLTFPTRILINRNLDEIFRLSKAPYRLLVDNRFVVFSPECFIRITGNTIRSFPMKGTIDASLADAGSRLLGDKKEIAEHNTIVDLIRNDLSMVATSVRVERFRYLEEIRTNQKHLLQASSEITGIVSSDWKSRIGSILQQLLPAGSVSGAPKCKTIEIIREAEPVERGYYTGVFGIFDGDSLDSAVMIRFIENKGNQMFFRSGGGITVNSIAENEYQEMIDKVYVPFI
jgi:para-aminobenzoate synthetase component I